MYCRTPKRQVLLIYAVSATSLRVFHNENNTPATRMPSVANEREQRIDFDTERHEENLDADQHQDHRKRYLEILEPMHGRSQRKIQRTQTQYGEDIRSVNDEWIERYREYGWNQSTAKTRSTNSTRIKATARGVSHVTIFAGFGVWQLHRKIVTMQLLGDVEMTPQPHQNLVVVKIRCLVSGCEHLYAGEHEECTKQIQGSS